MKALLIALVLFNYYSAFSQIKVSYGPELGVNISGIQSTREATADHVYVTEIKNPPVITPILGFYGEVQFGKHFLINSGLFYKKVGNTYYKLSYTDGLPQITYELYIKQEFNVSSLPIMVGYNFFLGNSQFQIKMGYVFNYFFNGNRLILENFTDSTTASGTQSQLNPFDQEYFYIPATHWNNQCKVSMGMNIKEKWNLNVFSSSGYDLFYLGGDSYDGTSLNNFDLGLTINYNIFKIKSDK